MGGDTQHLFVYGTLRRAADHPMARLLASASDHVGEGRFQGRLYRVSWYPCAVSSEHAEDRIVGDVFAIHADAAPTLFSTLDEYEGTRSKGARPPYYLRERHGVQMTDGRELEAWIYLFNRSTAGLERIESGDFLLR